MIETLFDFLFAKSIGISLLLLIILMIRPLVLKKLNAQAAYALWLIIPVFLFFPLSLFEQSTNSQVMTFFPGGKGLLPLITPGFFSENSSFESIVFFLWLIGVVALISIYIVRFHKLKCSLTTFEYQLPSQQLTHRVDFKLKKVLITNSNLVKVPAIFGFINAILILPKGFENQPETQQIMILRHELYHIARRDHQVNLVRILFKSLFWFNPLVYWADKFVEADQELSCDLGVLKFSPRSEKKNYAAALINSAGGGNQNYFVSQWRYQSLIKQRVKMLKNTNQKQWHSWVAVGIAIVSMWTTSMVIASEQKPTIVEAVPIVVIEPGYPTNAVKEGVEGYVRFKMNVDANGQPFDIKVLESQPKDIFEEQATKAITKWKFKPKLVNGKGVTQYDIRYTLEFKLAD